MDPSGSELDSSLPQPETPCLIVEDSQPDSLALEDDPESSYRALLAKRLSNLQPHAPSPVLELISSPQRDRLSQKDSQSSGNHNNHSHEPDQSLEALENSPVLDIVASGDPKMADMDDMDAGADSTTCAQTEAESMSQFGMLELSESQGFHDEPHKSGDMKNVGRNSQSQDLRRSEVSSSSKDSQRLSIQALLHSQAADDEDIVSSQEDLFEGEEEEERAGTRVDSTVNELGNRSLPTSTPADSLHLLHLSGQGTLVQESLSQQSVDYVAATQERMSQTPLIVPNSPTGDEPMDISRAGGSQSQRGDGRPKGSSPVHKPRPTSTPVSQNSPGFVLDKSLTLPSQPEFSHDTFVVTPSLDQLSERASGPSSSQTQSPPTVVKVLSSRTGLTLSSQNTLTAAAKDAGPAKHLSPAAQSKQVPPPPSSSSQVGASFQLELSSTSQPSIFFQKTQSFLMDEDEDSQATQIEEVEEKGEAAAAAGTDVGDGGPKHAATAATPAASITASPSKILGGGLPSACRGRVLHSSQPDPYTQPASQNVNVGRSLSQGSPQAVGAKPLVGARAESTAVRSPPGHGVPVVVPSSLPSQSVLSVHSSPRPASASQKSLSQAGSQKSLSQAASQRSLSQAGSQAPSQSQSQHSQPLSQRSLGVAALSQGRDSSLVVVEETQKQGEEGMEVDSKNVAGSSGLCLAISQSQNFDAEPMEEDLDLDEVETQVLVPATGSQRTHGVPTSSGGPTSPQRSQRESQQQQREKGVSASQPTAGLSSPERRREMEKSISPGKGSLSQPERGSRADPGPRRSQSQGLSDSSGDIPFHFTLPKEGELIRPIVTATPPLISQLKKTPRHSTPIEMTSFSGASEGDVTRGTTLADSDILAEESMEEPAATAATEASGKLSLRMKLVTPVEEASSGSERFSLQKPPLSDDDGSVVKATTVAKAVSSPSVFSRVREAHRQEPVEEEVAQPSVPSPPPPSGGMFNSPQRLGGGSQASDSSPCPLMTSTQSNSVDAHPSQPLSPSSQQGTVGNGTPRKLSQQANGAASQSTTQHAPTVTSQADARQSAQVGVTELTPPRAPARQRAVSQQTSFDVPVSTSNTPSKRAVSQQTSFDGAQNSSGRGEAELSSPRPPPGVRLRRHVRTIQEVRTTVTRIITDVYYEDGREVDRKVTEESEEPVVDCRVLDSDLSPSRTGSSMTSGDLADVSSLSSKASSLAHSSSGSTGKGTGTGTATSGPGRHPDFLKPTGRGAAKSGSPRRGRKHPQSPVSERSKVQGSRPLTPVTPRGRSRRGRPPSRSPHSRGGRGGAHNMRPAQLSSSQEEEEEEQERFTRVNTKGGTATPPAGPSSRAGGGATASDSSLVGLRVVAKWSSNGYFYSGRITSDLGSGRFRLLFDDGYECEVQGRDVLLCDPIPTETEVTAISEDEYFCTGVVKGHKTVGRELQYCVEREGQQQQWYSRASVILSMEQGSRLREQYGLDPYEPLTPLTKAADISLDNLVDGKRRRRGNSAVNTPDRSSSTSSPGRTPGPSGKRKLISSAEDERRERTPAKRGRKSGPNKAGSRSAVGAAVSNTSESDAGVQAGAGTGVCNTSGSGTDLPSDPSDLLSSHGPLPTSDSLFMGFAFLLTASSFNDRLSNLATSDEEEDYLPTAPYNKRYITSQLEAGGGLVLPDFNEDQCKAAYQSLLIADQHCRTRKFLLCVASGVPCVSNVWVRDCCQEQKLLNYRNYLLPAGLGPGQRVIEWHPRCSPFKALRVLLVFGGAADLWVELLKLSGAASVKHAKGGDDTDIPANTFDVMVTEKSCPSAVVRLASTASLPVVSLEWLVQSLIVGERQDYTADPQYSHDYVL